METNEEVSKVQQANRLKHIRELHGLMQYEMAQKLNYQKSTYNQIEQGKYRLNGAAVQLLKMMFNINPLWFREGHGDMYLKKSVYSADEWKHKYEECRMEVERLNLIIDGLVKKPR